MRKFVVSAAALLLAGGAQAGESTKPAAAYMDLQPIGAPAVVHGRLVNYIFVDIRLVLARGVDAAKLQDQEPYLRDALVRAATRTPFNPPEDGLHLDRKRLQAEVVKDAEARFGPGKVVAVEVRSETPQRRVGVPGRLPG